MNVFKKLMIFKGNYFKSWSASESMNLNVDLTKVCELKISRSLKVECRRVYKSMSLKVDEFKSWRV